MNPDLMEPHQQKVFEMFVHLGPERSLAKLLAICQANGVNVSEPTLKRWSSRFKWQELVKRTENEISNRIADEAMVLHVKSLQLDLDSIEVLKRDFRKRVADGAIVCDNLADYALLLKIEAQIVGDPSKRKEFGEGDMTVNNDNRIVLQLTDEQINRYMHVDAQLKHGLPPAPTPVTIDHE